jgi:hypothetical protein
MRRLVHNDTTVYTTHGGRETTTAGWVLGEFMLYDHERTTIYCDKKTGQKLCRYVANMPLEKGSEECVDIHQLVLSLLEHAPTD